MTVLRLAASSAIVLVASVSSGHAGPCSARIEQMMTSIDAKLGARAAGGQGAPENAGALTHRQPTPGSIAAAEQALGEVSAEKIDLVNGAMARARQADGAGDAKACGEALDEVQRAIGP